MKRAILSSFLSPKSFCSAPAKATNTPGLEKVELKLFQTGQIGAITSVFPSQN
jgi:hypothetical protein